MVVNSMVMKAAVMNSMVESESVKKPPTKPIHSDM